MGLSGYTSLAGTDLYTSQTVPQHRLGQLGIDSWGSRYRYVKVGASALVTADCLQEPAESTDFVSMSVNTAAAIGSTEITVTLGATATTANMFDGGFLTVSVTPGLGQSFRILSHTVASGAASCTFTVDRPLLIALTTSSDVSVRKNPYNGVIQNPATTSTGGPVGFALYATPASSYGWIQSGGDTAVTYDTGGNTANDLLGIEPSLAVAGAVKVSAGTSGDAYIGFARQVASVDATSSIAHIMID